MTERNANITVEQQPNEPALERPRSHPLISENSSELSPDDISQDEETIPREDGHVFVGEIAEMLRDEEQRLRTEESHTKRKTAANELRRVAFDMD
jgi:hypothetical protein